MTLRPYAAAVVLAVLAAAMGSVAGPPQVVRKAPAPARPLTPGTPATIQVAFPASGANLNAGQNSAIVWTYSGIDSRGSVDVTLLRNDLRLGDIARSVPIQEPSSPAGWGALQGMWTTGSYIGGSAEPGCGYAIRVSVAVERGEYGTSNAFCIAPPVQAASLQLLAPRGGESWGRGSVQRISWSCPGCTGRLRIALSKGDQPWGVIARPEAAAGFYEWKVGEMPPPYDSHDFATGGDYRITIATHTDQLKDESAEPFTIIAPGRKVVVLEDKAHRWLKVTSPVSGAVWHSSQVHDIRWDMADDIRSEFARIVLLRGGQVVLEVEDHRPLQQGVHPWQLWAGDALAAAGDYQIRIQCIKYPEVVADSPVFQIVPTATFSNPIFPGMVWQGEHKTGFKAMEYFDSYEPPTSGGTSVVLGYWNVCNDTPTVMATSRYRGVVLFELAGLKGTVKWAKFSYVKNDQTPEGERHVYALTLPWGGGSADMWSATGFEVDPHNVEQMRALVQGWVDDPPTNHGLLMAAREQTDDCSSHRMVLTDIRLDIGIESVQ